MPVIAVQTVVCPSDIPVANATYLVLRQLGPVIFVAVSQAVFLNKLLPAMQAINPNLTKAEIVQAGATGLKMLVGESDLPRVLVGYVKGFDAVFILASILAGISSVVALGVEWNSIKKEKSQEHFAES
jgi:sugar phosphate permease